MSNFRKTHLAVMSMSAVLLVFMSSCSSKNDDRRAELVSLTSNDAILTGAFDPSAVFKSAGATVDGGKVVLPQPLQEMAGDGDDRMSAILRLATASGLNYRSMAFSVYEDDAYALFCLSDAGKFGGWAEKEGYETSSEDGCDIYMKEDAAAIVADGDVAWIVGNVGDALSAVNKVRGYQKSSIANPVPQWKADRLSEGDAAFMVDINAVKRHVGEEMSKAGLSLPFADYSGDYVGLNFTFDGPSLRFRGEAYDAKGAVVTMLSEGTYSPIASEALSLVKDSQIVISFPFYAGWKDMAAELCNSVSPEYAGAISGALSTLRSISIGASLRQGASIATFSFADLDVSVVVDYDKVAAAENYKELADLGKAMYGDAVPEIPAVISSEDSTYVVAPYPALPDLKLYITNRGNLAIMSTSADKGKSEIRTDKDLDGLISYGAVDLEKSHPLLQLLQCPFGIKVKVISYPEVSEGEISLTECEGGFLENLINYFSRL